MLIAAAAGLARTETGLDTCLGQVLGLRQRAEHIHVPGSRRFNPGWHTARGLQFLMTVAEAIVHGALVRLESRGAHWRLDFLEKDPAWGRQNLIAHKDGSAMRISTRPVAEMPPELARLFAPTTLEPVPRASLA